MTGFTWELGRVVDGVQLLTVTHHQFDENDFQGRIFKGVLPQLPALIDGQIVDAPQSVKDTLAGESRDADFAANGERYTLQNQYLAMCDQLTGSSSHAKLGFTELQAVIVKMQESQPAQAMGLALQLLTLNAALVRCGGIQWWDNCEWTEGL